MISGHVNLIIGANLLTNKDGSVKLADFGVASKTAGVSDNTVVGSPYWSEKFMFTPPKLIYTL